MLSLPGAAYIYQGEELGLFEVADLPADQLQDPIWPRSGHTAKGRDGCRVPLPWTASAPTFGFADGRPHLAMPEWFGSLSVRSQEADAGSSLALHRRALALRRGLAVDATVALDTDAPDSVVHIVRSDGVHSVTNFGAEPVALPAGEVLLASGPLDGPTLPPDTTAWVRSG